MKIDTATLHASALELEDCPVSTLSEFAFVGRSNVGKSSLINMLTGKAGLAHTSGKPGKTRLIHFYRINSAWTLVDLPGYGYAKVSKEKQRDFNVHVSAYLTGRENLKHTFVLVDSRLEPLGGDFAFAEWLQDCRVPYSIIFTKIDRSSDTKVKDHTQLFMDELEAWKLKPTRIFHCSSKTGRGRGQILQWIEQQLPKKKKKKSAPLNLAWMKKR